MHFPLPGLYQNVLANLDQPKIVIFKSKGQLIVLHFLSFVAWPLQKLRMTEIWDPNRIYGWIAVSLSLIYKFPQIIHLQRTKDVRGISISSQLIQSSAYVFYIIHGTIIKDPPVLLLGFTSMAQSAVLICQYYYYSKYAQLHPTDSSASAIASSSASAEVKSGVNVYACEGEAISAYDPESNTVILAKSAGIEGGG